MKKEKIIEAKRLIDCIIEMQSGYEKLDEPSAHINICSIINGKRVSTPLCDTVDKDVQKLIEIRMNEHWNSLRKLFD